MHFLCLQGELAAVSIFAVVVCGCASGMSAVTPGKGAADFSGRYASPDGLFVVHYPPDLPIKQVSEHVVLLYAGDGGSVTFRVTPAPVSGAVDDRMPPAERPGGVVRDRTQEHTACFGAVPGVLRTGTFVPKIGPPEQWFWECMFVKNQHQFTFSYTVPHSSRPKVGPLLEKIVAAAEVR